jgi:hypothetical protein
MRSSQTRKTAPLRKVIGYFEDLGAAWPFKAWVRLECGHEVYVPYRKARSSRRRAKRCDQCTVR